jgi:hypothetical protein
MDAKILQPFFYQRLKSRTMQKPILVITITDGGQPLQPKVCECSLFSGPQSLMLHPWWSAEPTQEPEDRIYAVIRHAKDVPSEGSVAHPFAQPA